MSSTSSPGPWPSRPSPRRRGRLRVAGRLSRWEQGTPLPAGEATAVHRPLSSVLVAAGLIAYANSIDGLALARGREHFGLSRIGLNVVGVSGLIAWAARREGLSARDMGLRRESPRALAIGLATGLAMAGPPLALFFLPRVPGGKLRYQPLSEAGRGAFLRRLLIEMPVGTAICEEIAFRGVLQALLRRRLGPLASVLWSSLPFTLWHVAVNINTLRRTSLPRRPRVVGAALAGGLASVFAGGLIFGALREATGSLPAAIAAHWSVDAVMLLALYRHREAPAAAVLALDAEEE